MGVGCRPPFLFGPIIVLQLAIIIVLLIILLIIV